MIDYSKVFFNELDDSEYPLQAFFDYDMTQPQIDEWIASEDFKELSGLSVGNVELALTIFGRHDFKLEAVCTSSDNKQHWVELNDQFTNADKLLARIPDDKKSKLKELFQKKASKQEREL